MKRLLLILPLLFFLSCSSWQREIVSSGEKCIPTGERTTNVSEYPLGAQVWLINVTQIPLNKCDYVTTYKNVRYSNITGEKLRCSENNAKCRERVDEVNSSRMAPGKGISHYSLKSYNPDIKVENDRLLIFKDNKLAAIVRYDLQYIDPPKASLQSIITQIKCVDPDGSTASIVNDIDVCLEREVKPADIHHDVKVHLID